ncbi:MAG: antibiotic biosynthesis monooxygenase [Pseudomonadota bacterium]
MASLPKGAFCLEGHIDVPEDRIPSVTIALEEHIELTRQEPGCIYFKVDPCQKVKGRFLVSEAFVNEEAFRFHQERAAASSWGQESSGLSRDYRTRVVS